MSDNDKRPDNDLSGRDVDQRMAAFRAALARMDRDPQEAARIQALADKSDEEIHADLDEIEDARPIEEDLETADGTLGGVTVAGRPSMRRQQSAATLPAAAARLVIVLLQDTEPVDATAEDAPVIVTLPQPGVFSGPRAATVPDPEFATLYQAEMPALISFLIKCGAESDDAPDIAQDAFRELFALWKTVGMPKPWLRKVAFRTFLRRPIHKAASPEEYHDEPTSPDASSMFDFGDEEQTFSTLTRRMPVTQRAVLALHLEQFQVLDIAEILGMKPETVRKNLKEARATLMKSLSLDDTG
jgi:RNA polymerase sigma factor (sigma-70 family)